MSSSLSASSVSAGQNHDRVIAATERDVSLNTLPSPADDEAQKTSLEEISLTQKMLSAVSGSIFTSLLVTPLDVVRVRLQSQNNTPTEPSKSSSFGTSGRFSNLPPNLGVTACCREVFWVNNQAQYCVATSNVAHVGGNATSMDFECAAEESQKKNFNSTFDGMRKIARNEGFWTLWRGLSPTLAMAVPGNVIYFAGYDWLRSSELSPMHNRVKDEYAPLVAGSGARMIAALFVSPIELFRTRMQAASGAESSGAYNDTLSGVRSMVSNQGVLTLWRGLGLTLWRDVPFSALYWWGYEAGRNLITDFRARASGVMTDEKRPIARRRSSSRSRQNNSTTLVDSFTAGAVSGGISSVITTPFDVGKTRQQVYQHAGDSGQKASAAELKQALGTVYPDQQSMPKLLSHIYQQEGLQGLFRGWAARCMKVAPACAIMISTYELGKKFAQSMRDRDEANSSM